jgi:hypothetical protein
VDSATVKEEPTYQVPLTERELLELRNLIHMPDDYDPDEDMLNGIARKLARRAKLLRQRERKRK